MTLDIKYHHPSKISIKDKVHHLNLSELKWDAIIQFFYSLGEFVYLNGVRNNYIDDSFYETLEYLADKILIDNGDNHYNLLLRIKTVNITQNRSLVAKLWTYYENPSLIFLHSEEEELTLISVCEKTNYIDDIIKSIDGIIIIYQGIESDVLWIESDVPIGERIVEIMK